MVDTSLSVGEFKLFCPDKKEETRYDTNTRMNTVSMNKNSKINKPAFANQRSISCERFAGVTKAVEPKSQYIY